MKKIIIPALLTILALAAIVVSAVVACPPGVPVPVPIDSVPTQPDLPTAPAPAPAPEPHTVELDASKPDLGIPAVQL